MGRISSAELREKFIAPLVEITERLAKAAKQLEELETEGEVPFLPSSHKMAYYNVVNLDDWTEKEVVRKIRGAALGTARFNQSLNAELKKIRAAEAAKLGETLKPLRKGRKKKKK